MSKRYLFERDTDFSRLPETDWLANDTETGGLDASRNALLSIAVWSPTYQNSWYVQPIGQVEPSALAVNHLDTAVCASEGLRTRECAERLMAAMKGKSLIGHNIGFDLSFIARRVFGLGPTDDALLLFRGWRILDTYAMYSKLHPDEPKHLSDIVAHYGIEHDVSRLHDALYDAEMTGRCYLAMRQEMIDG